MSTQQQVPNFTAGFVFLGVASVIVAVFGVAGWLLSDANIWQKLVIGSLTAVSAAVIPFTIIALGRAYVSSVIVVTASVFAMITAYSFHHGVEVLVEAPRKAVHMSPQRLVELDDLYNDAADRVRQKQEDLDDFIPDPLPGCVCPQTIGAVERVNQARRAILEDALTSAKADRDALKAERFALWDKLEASYKPLAPDWVVWLAGCLIDLGIALGIFGLEATRHAIARQIARKETRDAEIEDANQLLKDELDEEMEELRKDVRYHQALETEIYDLVPHLDHRGEQAA